MMMMMKKQKNYIPIILFQSSNSITNSSINYINNVTVLPIEQKNYVNPIYSWVYEDFHECKRLINTDNFPTFLNQCDLISLPTGVKRTVEKLPKKILIQIDKDLKIAIEKCLIIASNCTSSIFNDCDNEDDKWKNLHSDFLQEQVQKGKDNTLIYNNVLKALTYKTNFTNPILEIRTNEKGTHSYLANEYSKQYRFHDDFQNYNIVNYKLKNQDSIQKRRKYFLEKLNKAYKDPIASNLINLYPKIDLPSEAEIITKGKELAKNKVKTKKGKTIATLNNKKKENIKDYNNKSFIEDGLIRYKFLVASKGYIIPETGTFASGGRVADSLNLMNSWIRNLIKIEGENIETIDYKALHPNLAIKIYGGKTKYITHQQIADYLNKDVKEIKIEHLSFFNKHPNQMKKSILFEYYSKREPLMLERILKDKKNHDYKITSIRMFALEVAIMKSCIIRLNADNEYVGYVYDALFCKESIADKVLKIMNEEIIKHGVYTTACKE